MPGKGNGGKNKGMKYKKNKGQDNNLNNTSNTANTGLDENIQSGSSNEFVFDIGKVKEMVAADKDRGNLKDPEIEKKKKEATVEYVDFRTEEEKEAEANEKAKEERDKEKTAEKERAEEEEQLWEGFNGEMLIFGMEELNLKVVPMVCDKMKRQRPDAAKILYSDRQKKMMRPGADIMMQHFIRLMKRPGYMFAGIALMHIFGVAIAQPKLSDARFDVSDPESGSDAF